MDTDTTAENVERREAVLRMRWLGSGEWGKAECAGAAPNMDSVLTTATERPCDRDVRQRSTLTAGEQSAIL